MTQMVHELESWKIDKSNNRMGFQQFDSATLSFQVFRSIFKRLNAIKNYSVKEAYGSRKRSSLRNKSYKVEPVSGRKVYLSRGGSVALHFTFSTYVPYSLSPYRILNLSCSLSRLAFRLFRLGHN